MDMAKIAYIRVSSSDQNVDRQIEAVKSFGIDRYFIEKASGKNTQRIELQKMLDYVREGDVLYIAEFSRLARSLRDLLQITDLLQEKHVQIISCKEKLDTTTPTGKCMLQMIAAIDELERATLLERQRDGIRLAKARGVYQGRKRISVEQAAFEALYTQWRQHKISKSKMAANLHVSRTVIDRLIREQEAQETTHAEVSSIAADPA